MQFDLDLELNYEIEGEYRKGSPDTRSWACPMGYPGDPEEFEVRGVWISNGKTRMNILSLLNDKTIELIEEVGIEVGREECDGEVD